MKTAYREAILDAAVDVFARTPYGDAKMSQIASEAGVAVGTLYNYFDTKEAVFAAAVARARTEFFEQLEPALGERDPLTRIAKVVEVTLSTIESYGLMFPAAEYQQEPDAEGVELRNRYRAALRVAVDEAAAAGHIRTDIPPDDLVHALGGLMRGFIDIWLEEGVPLKPKTPLIVELFRSAAAPRGER